MTLSSWAASSPNNSEHCAALLATKRSPHGPSAQRELHSPPRKNLLTSAQGLAHKQGGRGTSPNMVSVGHRLGRRRVQISHPITAIVPTSLKHGVSGYQGDIANHQPPSSRRLQPHAKQRGEFEGTVLAVTRRRRRSWDFFIGLLDGLSWMALRFMKLH